MHQHIDEKVKKVTQYLTLSAEDNAGVSQDILREETANRQKLGFKYSLSIFQSHYLVCCPPWDKLTFMITNTINYVHFKWTFNSAQPHNTGPLHRNLSRLKIHLYKRSHLTSPIPNPAKRLSCSARKKQQHYVDSRR